MLLTKKRAWKIALMTVCYFLLGCFCLYRATQLRAAGQSSGALLTLAIVCYVLCPLIVLWGLYAEGKGRLLQKGNRLVRFELRPGEFLKQYHALREEKLVLCRPSVELLVLLTSAYDTVGDRDGALAAADAAIDASRGKQRTVSKLFKASLLFSFDRIDEAEALFVEAQGEAQNATSRYVIDMIRHSDRAMAMGDYTDAQVYNLGLLQRAFPRLDPLGIVSVHFTLGVLYERMEKPTEAISYYRFCVANGNETSYRTFAAEALERLT